MRCFIAIDIPPEVKENVGRLINDLRPYSTGVRWVRPEGIHITLRFLGEVKDKLLPELHTSIRAALEGIGPFQIHLKGTGVFPDYRRPRVLWIGIEESSGLSAIHEKTEDALVRLGFQRETRPFNPHLTAGRIKSLREIRDLMREWRGHKDDEFGKIDVSEIHLMKSTLKPTGAEYESLYTIKLNEGGLDGKG